MPYIAPRKRTTVWTEGALEAGELNFLLTSIGTEYVTKNGLSYHTINDVMGAFACAAQEFYRRVAADYEDLAIIRNGDVYPLTMTGIPRG